VPGTPYDFIDSGPSNSRRRAKVGLADVGIDEGNRLTPDESLDEGLHQGRLARIGSAEQQEDTADARGRVRGPRLALAKRTRVHNPVRYHVSPVLNHDFTPHQRDDAQSHSPWSMTDLYHRARGRKNQREKSLKGLMK
jgi:hypothetical protein